MGLGYGASAILGEARGWPLPVWYTDLWWAYLWNLVLPAASMWIVSKGIDLRRGRLPREELRGLVYSREDDDPSELRESMAGRLARLQGTWLHRTLAQAPVRPRYPFPVGAGGPVWYRRPGLWAGAYLAVAAWLLFVVLW